MPGENAKIFLELSSKVSEDDIRKFASYFGELEACCLLINGPVTTVVLRFSTSGAKELMLRWPYPLFIQGHFARARGSALPEDLCDETLSTVTSLAPTTVEKQTLCLAINRIPLAWKASSLFYSLLGTFGDSFTLAMVTKKSNSLGYRQAVVESTNLRLCLELLEVGEHRVGAKVLEFRECMFDKIGAIDDNMRQVFTFFPEPKANSVRVPTNDAINWNEFLSPAPVENAESPNSCSFAASQFRIAPKCAPTAGTSSQPLSIPHETPRRAVIRAQALLRQLRQNGPNCIQSKL